MLKDWETGKSYEAAVNERLSQQVSHVWLKCFLVVSSKSQISQIRCKSMDILNLVIDRKILI